MNLPPLPDPSFKLVWRSDEARYLVSKPNIGSTDVFTADKMRERDVQIWNLARKQALEEAARLCDEMQPIPASEPRHCAEDIRSLIK